MRRLIAISCVLISVFFALPFPNSPNIYGQRKASSSSRAKARAATSAASSTASSAARQQNGAEQITAAQLKDYLTFIASDELEGRDTPSRGLDVAAKFIATNLSRWGLKAAGDNGTYFQRFPLSRYKIKPAESRAQIGDDSFNFGADFVVPLDGSASAPAITASGPMVYVGDGWIVKSKNINSYQGIEVRDKILIITANGLPKGVTPADLGGEPGENWESPDSYAQRHGAKGIIMIPGFQTLSNWDRLRQNGVERGSLSLKRPAPEQGQQLPRIMPSMRMLTALFRGERGERSAAEIFRRKVANEPGQSFDLAPAKQINFTVSLANDPVTTQNVVAVLEGSDPVLKNEYVAIGAHYDHVGVGAAVNGDALYNGADDDGSGTVAVLALAEAFARGGLRPKRSILFVWHAGEEKGLWGSSYFTDHPTVPINGIITQINIDMIGRSKKEGDTNPANKELTGPNAIYVIGSKMMSTQLGAAVESVNKSYLNLTFDFTYDDPADPNRFFFRSDHYNYAQKGIPVVFYFDGVHEDYHQPSDTIDKIDFQKMERVARTIYATTVELANAATRPQIDKQLPEELRTSRRGMARAQ